MGKKNIIIGILIGLLIGMSVLTVLALNGTLRLDKDSEIDDNIDENITDNQNENIQDIEDVNNESDGKVNITIDKYIGTWYLVESGGYSYINIEKSSNSSTNYMIDIRVNKMADYNDLALYCAENSGVCYFSGDENHNFSLIMAFDQVQVFPDYVMIGTSWTFDVR